MLQEENFLSPHEHFDALVQALDDDTFKLFERTKSARIETAFRGRTFVLYKMSHRNAEELDTLTVEDYQCDDEQGASSLLRSRLHGRTLEIGYSPVQIFEHPVLMCHPLHGKLRFSTTASNIHGGKLGWPMLIRTTSRHVDRTTGYANLREKGVTYCETGVSYAKEFGQTY